MTCMRMAIIGLKACMFAVAINLCEASRENRRSIGAEGSDRKTMNL